jgi:predicted RNase H-like HicB family nuclease
MSEIIFIVEDSDEGGYAAKALGHSIYTEGETLEELRRNIKDAVKCHFDTGCDV